jgi:YidC/Oxa1 family membrane protein insertase
VLNFLYQLVAKAIVAIHSGLAAVFGDSGFTWWLSIIVLTVAFRLILFPLFVKQVKSQRKMQMLQPLYKEIREKYKNDKAEQNRQLMALQAEHGNPLLGCLPLVAQIPLFIALFHVLRNFAPIKNAIGGGYHYKDASHTIGLSADTVQQVASAKVFGVPLAAMFKSTTGELGFLHASATSVKVTAVILIALMAASTFLTQKQVMGRNAPTDPQQATVQKVMLYIIPLFLLFTGTQFPIGVLLYWVTTNAWSLGQQFFILRRMPPIEAAAVLPGAGSRSAGAGGSAAPAKPKGLMGRLMAVAEQADTKQGKATPQDASGRGDKGRTVRSAAQSRGRGDAASVAEPAEPAAAAANPAAGGAKPGGPTPARRPGQGPRPAKRRGKGQRPGGRR